MYEFHTLTETIWTAVICRHPSSSILRSTLALNMHELPTRVHRVINLIEGLETEACTQPEFWVLFWEACSSHPPRAQTVEWEPLCPSSSPSLFVVQYLMPLLSDIVCSFSLMEKRDVGTCAGNLLYQTITMFSPIKKHAGLKVYY